MAAGVNSASLSAQNMMSGLTAMMTEGGSADPESAGRKAFSMMLRREALVMAFGDVFLFLTAGCVAAAILGLLASPAGPVQDAGPAPKPDAAGGH
jgi:hypothetical protein